MQDTYYAHGKLLLTGEYFVLDGALALATPTQRGQILRRKQKLTSDTLEWESCLLGGEQWFTSRWKRTSAKIELVVSNSAAVAQRFGQLLTAIEAENSAALDQLFGYAWESQLEFPRDWGLGSSSTLVSLLAQVTATNPYGLLAGSFGGSGYDLACAQADGPILYQRIDGQARVEAVKWQPPYSDQLYFVHLGHKQNSREGIRLYRELGGAQVTLIDAVSDLTRAFLAATDSQTAADLARAHEELISNALQIPRAQDLYFSDFLGTIKSLGAWGGDFVCVLSEQSPVATKAYFSQRGYDVIIPWESMVCL